MIYSGKELSQRLEKETDREEKRQLTSALKYVKEQRAIDMIDDGLAFEADYLDWPGF